MAKMKVTKKFKTKGLKRLLFAAVVAIAAAAQALSTSSGPSASAEGAARTVFRITDGDTLVLENGEKVRLIGVDTPEIHDSQGRNAAHARRFHTSEAVVDSYAQKAREFLELESEGKKVRLEYGGEKTDKYGRTLAFVYRESDGLFLNAEILKRGYGFAYTRFPFKYSDDFKRYEAEARRNREGLWK